MDNQNGDSGANTVLIVIVLLILVGFGAWWLTMRTDVAPKQNDVMNVDVRLPTPTHTPEPTPEPTPTPQ